MSSIYKKNSWGIIWIASSQTTMIISNFALLKLLTNHLSIESYGTYILYMSFALFARQILYDPISITLGKYVGTTHEDEKATSRKFQEAIYITTFIGLISLVAGLIIGLAEEFTNSNRTVLTLGITVYLITNGAQGVYINMLNSTKQRKKAALLSITDATTKIITAIIFLHSFSNTEEAALLAVAASSATTTLGFVYFEKSKNIQKHKKKIFISCKKTVTSSIPLLIPATLTSFKSITDRWSISAFSGVDELAAYSVLQMVGYTPMIIVIGMIQTLIAPKIYSFKTRSSGENHNEVINFMNRIMLSALAFSLAATMLSAYFSDMLLKTLTNNDFSEFSKYLPAFTLAGGMAAAANILNVFIISLKSNSTTARLMAISTTFGICSTIFLVLTLKITGATIAMLLAAALPLLVYYHAIKHNKTQ